MKSIILFASGRGSNALAIIQYFKNNPSLQVAAIVCNNPQAGVIQIAKTGRIPLLLTNRNDFHQETFIKQLKSYHPDLIVLAGFLWKIPESVIQAFPNQIINLHPALLPKYGGKGMYGSHVHEAVKAAGEKESGITIHWVNEHYDEGKILLQARCPVSKDDRPEDIAAHIHRLEHYYLPRTIEFLLFHSGPSQP